MNAANADSYELLTRRTGYFEDFAVGDRLRHARGATIGEVENNLLTKQVMNTGDGHWNEHVMEGSPLGEGRLVFGLITGSVVFGLASQDTTEHAIAELGCTGLRFRGPVHLGDTIYACSEVLTTEHAADRDDAGVVTFHHWGLNQDDEIVFEGRRSALIKRRSHWDPDRADAL